MLDAATVLDALFSGGEDYVVALDASLVVQRASPGFSALAAGRTFLDTTDPAAREKALTLLGRAARPRRTLLLDHVDADGAIRRIGWRVAHLPEGFLLLGRDTLDETRRLRQIVRLHRELSTASATARRLTGRDQLTGLLCRAEALRAANATWLSTPSCAVILADIDGMGAVNRRLGLKAGDRVLHAVARALYEVTPENAVLARWDGDAFLVVAPGEGKGLAAALLEAVRGAHGDSGDGGEGGVTASIGAAVVTDTRHVPFVDALAAADAALAEVRHGDADLALVRRLQPRQRGEGPPGHERRRGQ